MSLLRAAFPVSLAALFPLTLAALADAGREPRLPDTIPACTAPQLLNPPQNLGPGTALLTQRMPVAWNGAGFATAYPSGSNIMFQKIFADGTPDGSPVTVTPDAAAAPASGVTGESPVLIWTGAGYAAAWTIYTNIGGRYQVEFARLDASGAPLAATLRLSFNGGSQTANSREPSLDWNPGSQRFLATWSDDRGANGEIYGAFLDAGGTVTRPDFNLTNAGGGQYGSKVSHVGNSPYNKFLVAWLDYATAPYQIRGVMLDESTVFPVAATAYTASPSSVQSYPSVVAATNSFALVWQDIRDAPSNGEIYFRQMSSTGALLGSELRVTSDAGISYAPAVAWSGSEFGLLWSDNRSGYYDDWFQRVSASGGLSGGAVAMGTGFNEVNSTALAAGQPGYLAVANAGQFGGLDALAIGCAVDSTPPSCAGNLLAYNISGIAATISWGPASDAETGVAYYQLYRNNQAIARTAAAYYADSGLPLNTTQNYMVQPVNASRLQNTLCTASLYIKTNSSLTLTMGKSDPNALLNWTDAGLNSYNIFRGTSPQVMSQIGATPTLAAQDANALTNTISYFYTVDDPGQ